MTAGSWDPGRFAGGDVRYLRGHQYRDSARLSTRANLHARYSTSSQPWFEFVLEVADLPAAARVLEAGCGAGWLWEAVPGRDRVALTLTDFSSGMVHEAVGRARAHGWPSVHGVTADVAALPVEAGSFDRVIANHMLYHLPDPATGVAGLARAVAPDGAVVVATNGRRHMREIWALRAEVFGTAPVDPTVDVFGVETGFPVLRDHFGSVEWIAYDDRLRITDADDVVAYICSTPPGETATHDEVRALTAAVHAAMAEGDGVVEVGKDTGCFVCRHPRPASPFG